MIRGALIAAYWLTASAVGWPVLAAEGEDCSHFKWNVAHEVAVMAQSPRAAVAATQASGKIPVLRIDRVYELQLGPQTEVVYGVPPAKSKPLEGARGGLAKFRVDKPGTYRISLASGPWIDVVDGSHRIESRGFQGSHECARLHKIVEFELPADKALLLQFSASSEPSVRVAITRDRDAK